MAYKERAVISDRLPTNFDALAVHFTFKAKKGTLEDAVRAPSFKVNEEVAELDFSAPTTMTALAILYTSKQDISVNFKVFGEDYETERIFFINKYTWMWAILRTDIPKPVTRIELAFHQKAKIFRVVPLASFKEQKSNEYFSISTNCTTVFSEKLVVPNLRSGRMMKIPINLTLLKARIPALIDSLEPYGDCENEFICKALCGLALVHPLGPARFIDYVCTGNMERFKEFLFLSGSKSSTQGNDGEEEEDLNASNPSSPGMSIESGASSPRGISHGSGSLDNWRQKNNGKVENSSCQNINIMQLPVEYLKVEGDVTSVIRLKDEPVYCRNRDTGKFECCGNIKGNPNTNTNTLPQQPSTTSKYVKLSDIKKPIVGILGQLKVSEESFDNYIKHQQDDIYVPLVNIGSSGFVCVSEIISDIYYVSLAEIIVENTNEQSLNRVSAFGEVDYKVAEFKPPVGSKGCRARLVGNGFFGPNDIGWFSEDGEIFGKLLNGEFFNNEYAVDESDEVNDDDYRFYPRNFMFVVLLLKLYYSHCLAYNDNGVCSKPRCMQLLLDDLLTNVPENIWGRKEFIDIVSNNLSPDSIDIAKYSGKFLDCVIDECADTYTLNVVAPYIIKDIVELRNEKRKGTAEGDLSAIKSGYWVRLKSCLTNRETRMLMTPNLKTDKGTETNAMNDRLVGIYFEKLNKELGTKKPSFGWQGLPLKSRQTIGRVVYYNERLDSGILQMEGNVAFRFRKLDVLTVGNGRIVPDGAGQEGSNTMKGKEVVIPNFFSNIFEVPTNPLGVGAEESYEPVVEGEVDINSAYPQVLQTRLRINSDIYYEMGNIPNDLFMWEIKYKKTGEESHSDLRFPVEVTVEKAVTPDTFVSSKLQSVQKLAADLKKEIEMTEKDGDTTQAQSSSSFPPFKLPTVNLSSSPADTEFFNKALALRNLILDCSTQPKVYHLNIKMESYDKIIREGGFKALKSYMDIKELDQYGFDSVLRTVVGSPCPAPKPVDVRANVFHSALQSLLPTCK